MYHSYWRHEICNLQNNYYTTFCFNITAVEPPLMDTSHKGTLPIGGHQTVVPAISSLKHYIFNLP